jgi:hypothetical protein
MSDIRGCIDYIKHDCPLSKSCGRRIDIGQVTSINCELVTPDFWNGECNCYFPTMTIEELRAELSELRREHLQDTLP